ncbi:polysaccharide deacetylase family protein [Novosphingobium profundi]|uniref:polysaccharide deacetylase family protein n=1 Tax=Novosphingobium profundi TaxID=1774954 RepID=UPI001BDA6F55|nr:polysaccharide deacetylase family protein [Novosphingobium profundi]MBT0671394.1 polysaccharide deacetylase family protein [Novosphingobium profundi]
MSLDPSYLEYPNRRLGYDHDMFPYSVMEERKPLAWPDGKTVATWMVVSLEWFPITPSDKPFKAPGHMQTAYPDYRHYTSREYGTRVGFYRLLDAFAKADVKVSVATNAAIAQRYPQVIRDILDAGHEIIAHSTDMNGTIASSLPVEEERKLITESIAILSDIAGVKPRGWHSIARSQSFATMDLLKDAGIEYCCDWVNDELPYVFNNGLVNIPLNHELSDRQIITVQQQSADSYAQQMLDAYDWLHTEAQAHGGRMLPMHLTPYIIGLPYRMDAFEQLLADLKARDGNWFARGCDILDSFRSQM